MVCGPNFLVHLVLEAGSGLLSLHLELVCGLQSCSTPYLQNEGSRS